LVEAVGKAQRFANFEIGLRYSPCAKRLSALVTPPEVAQPLSSKAEQAATPITERFLIGKYVEVKAMRPKRE
jgi:hypothetical protein